MEKLNIEKNYDKNKVLARVLFEFIKKSDGWNWMFELKTEDLSKIDKSDGMIIWLHTDWGGWKTTLIETLTNYLNPVKEKTNIKEDKTWSLNIFQRKSNKKDEENQVKSDYIIENINAWQFIKEKKEDLWVSIISYFYIKIVEVYKKELKEEKDFKSLVSKITLSNLASFTNKLTGVFLPQFSFFTEKLNDFTKEIDKNDPTLWLDKIKDNISLFYSMQEDIIKLLSNKKIKNKHKKYVLIIDDLDRCSPKEVIYLLDALKLFLNIPNMIVIVAVDRRHIEKWIYEVYNSWSNNKFIVNPDEYLEKIIHLPIDLFLFDEEVRDNKKNYMRLKENLVLFPTNEDIIEILETDYIKSIINLWLSNNPRKNLRFKRLFKFYYWLFNINFIWLFNQSKDIVQRFFTFWLILKMEWWNYFQEITKTPILLYLPYKNDYSNKDKVNQMLDYYSKIFYWIDDFWKLNNYESSKLKKFIYFINTFSEEIWDEYANVIKYFYSFQFWKTFSDDIKWNKLLIKPLIDLELFKSDDDFKERYKKLIEDFHKDDDDFYNSLSELEFSKFEDKIIKDIFKKVNNNPLKEVLIKAKNDMTEEKVITLFKSREKEEFNTNEKILDNAFPHYIKMITWIDTIKNAKEIDSRRFILWSKLFFDNILINKFDNLSKIEIDKETQLNIENLFIDFVNDEILNYNDDWLWKDHILNDLKNNEKRTLFWELINQMSFAKWWPSIWWMTWATDYTQLEAIVIEWIKDKNVLNEWQEILKNTIFVENWTSWVQHVMKFKQMIEFLYKNIKDENLLKKLNRLEKRLIYIFSHFWSFQKIDLYIPYYWTSKKWLKLLWLWENIYWNLDNSLNNYITFCIAFNDYKEKHIKSLWTNFEKELDEYITNIPHNLETLFKWSDIKVDKEYAKEFIKVKIIEHRLIRLLDFKEQQEETTTQDTN